MPYILAAVKQFKFTSTVLDHCIGITLPVSCLNSEHADFTRKYTPLHAQVTTAAFTYVVCSSNSLSS